MEELTPKKKKKVPQKDITGKITVLQVISEDLFSNFHMH